MARLRLRVLVAALHAVHVGRVAHAVAEDLVELEAERGDARAGRNHRDIRISRLSGLGEIDA